MSWSRASFLSVGLITVVCGVGGAACARPGPSLAGPWDGIVEANDVEVPFRLEIRGDDESLEASFFDGDQRVNSTAGVRRGAELTLAFAQYGARLLATEVDGRLVGRYDRGTAGAPYPFRAVRAGRPPDADASAPSVAGEWTIPHDSSKGERAWRLVVQQNGSAVSAAILRIDGDTGALTGSYRDGRFRLSHFSGARPMLLDITVEPDGHLALVQNQRTTLTAYRRDDARAPAAAAPSEPLTHTRIRDPREPFTFRFPDLDGRVMSEADFRGRVLLVSLTGSWCPNCHDEAPFLAELDRTYRDQGLSVVAFAFEEADQLAAPVRLRAFIRNFGITYPVLLAGLPEQLAEKVPQAENLNAFPTTIFVGRDGRMRAIHAGFASPASGVFHTTGKDEITALVRRLLAEAATARM